MSELSRMEKHQRRSKRRKKPSPSSLSRIAAMLREGFGGRKSEQGEGKRTASSETLRADSERSIPSRTVSRSVSRSSSGRKAMSTGKGMSGEALGRHTDNRQYTPSRSSTYMTHRVKMSKWFVNSLILIFVLLMAGLLVWGLMGAPPLKKMFG